MKIYVAGPMRGRPQHNFPAFERAAAELTVRGFDVVSPVTIGQTLFGNDSTVPGGQYLRADVKELAGCDAIALLPGWECSTGARCEVSVAITIGLTFFDAETCEQIAAPIRVTICGGYERAAGAVDTLDVLRDESIDWANAQFGAGAERQSAKIAHLRDEIEELSEDPFNLDEMADCFILLSHISTGLDLAGAVRRKLEKNKLRTWGTPDVRGVVRHVEQEAIDA